MKIFVYGSNRERCEEKKIMEDGSDLMGEFQNLHEFQRFGVKNKLIV